MRNAIAIFLVATVFAGTFSSSSSAATINKTINRSPASACVLSIPTTDTGARAKATGFRNEGTVNNFVICGCDIDTDSAGFSNLTLYFRPTDGASHAFDCTAMNRYATNDTGEYSTKSVSLAGNSWTYVQFLPADFPSIGLVGGASITCLLPPGVSIVTVAASHQDNVGN
jgi:hypothetical protein